MATVHTLARQGRRYDLNEYGSTIPGTWTPPAPAPSGDPYYYNVTLLLHFDGTNGQTTTTGSGPIGFTVSRTANCAIHTTDKKFGTAAMWQSGSGNFSVAHDVRLAPAINEDFTAEGWFKANSSGYRHIFGQENGAGTGWRILLHNSNWIAAELDAAAGGISLNGTASVNDNSWHHVALVRNGTGTNNCKIYVDGVKHAEGSYNGDMDVNSPFTVGERSNGGDDANCWIDEVRFTKGVARYTAAFTPPTAAFPDTVDTEETDPYYSSVVTLLHFNGTHGQTTGILDSGPNNYTITSSGGMGLTTIVAPKFGSACLSTSSVVGCYLQANAPNYAFSASANQDLTVECWVKKISNTNFGCMWSTNNASVGTGHQGQHFPDKTIYWNNAPGFGAVSTALDDANWHHVAWVRYGTGTNNMKIYVDGGMLAQQSNNNAITSNIPLILGSVLNGGSNNANIDSYIDEFRWTRGVARYTGSFTSPTRPFPNS